ncbi:MAG: hypothetical protein HY077_05010 [Elusimicrobia bacterium]|nr:hypothetical protein [Elusimicrobiota bacterium]
MKPTSISKAFLGLFLACPLRATGLQETYFGAGWAKTAPDAAPPDPASIPGPPPVGDLHNPVAHMDITLKAYQVYAARYGGGELERYIGSADGDNPAAEDDGNVVAGSFDEDKSFKNPWNDLFPMARHFWDCRQGYYKGWNGYDSSVNRAHKYWSGGYGIEGQYDSGWEKKGARGEGVLGLYGKGDKAKAYWYLGHVAHLLEDLTVPAHALLFTHVGEGTDMYESYMAHHFKEWTPAAGTDVESFGTLLELFSKTGDITNDFDAGHGPGDAGADGKKDEGARRAGGFTEAALKEEGAVLMPLAYRRVAALFLYFFKQLDHAPPKVTLAEPVSLSSDVLLEASAVDEQSGVDRLGYRFQVREDKVWRDLSPAPTGPYARFFGEPGRLYEFRASAVDAAGNRAFSAARAWRAGPLSVARR